MYVAMSVCVCVCVYVCMYVCMYVWMYGCMDVCMHACMHACIHVCMHALIPLSMCAKYYSHRILNIRTVFELGDLRETHSFPYQRPLCPQRHSTLEPENSFWLRELSWVAISRRDMCNIYILYIPIKTDTFLHTLLWALWVFSFRRKP